MMMNSRSGDSSGSDFDEYIVHQEGNEEIHITGKARKQLKFPLFNFNQK